MRPIEQTQPAPPRLVAWELTRHCVLNCRHCRAASLPARQKGELSTDECRRLLDGLAAFGRPTVILTGGDPMLRPDVYDVAARGVGLGLRVVMATCGALLNEDSVSKIQDAGIALISVSLDGASAATHDAFRGAEGSFEACLAGLEAARRAGLPFQINTTVSRHNALELPAILELAVRLGAVVFNPFLLVPTGRGKGLIDSELSPQDYERTLRWLAERSGGSPIPVRVTCAPHYQRILRQMGRGGPGGRAPQGCLGGKSFAFISSCGKVQICGFLEVECGDLREAGFDFASIWRTSEVLRRVRDVDAYGGRCGVCEFRRVCGGCRARAYALTGDYMAEEPYCVYQPRSTELADLDRRVLARVQADFPVVERPFDALAAELGVGADAVLQSVARFKGSGFIRRLGAVFDSQRLGYVSVLVAAKVPAERVADVAASVSRLPGVTHNYERDHEFNLWFTLTARTQGEVEDVLNGVRAATGVASMHALPAVARYKTRVQFDADGRAAAPADVPRTGPPVELSAQQEQLVRLLQGDLPVCAEPFAELAASLGQPVAGVLEQIGGLLAEGVIRRFGAVVDHRRLGAHANGMAVFAAGDGRADRLGRELAGCPTVTHCYRRRPMPGWPYDLFAMVHAPTRGEVSDFVADFARRSGVEQYAVLFSTVEHKKTSMRYFEEG